MDTLTIGAITNELCGNYNYGEGAWDTFIIDKMSPDVLLMYLAKMAAFYIKMGQTDETQPIPRAVKDLILKEEK